MLDGGPAVVIHSTAALLSTQVNKGLYLGISLACVHNCTYLGAKEAPCWISAV